MNAQELIQSGKLELYVAGALSPREMGEVAAIAIEHPEVTSEIQRIEQTVIAFLNEGGTQQAAAEKEQDITRLLKTVRGEKETAAVVGMSKAGIAALVGGLAVISAIAIIFGVRNGQLHHEVASLKTANDTLAKHNVRSDSQFVHTEQQVSIMRDIITKRIELTTVAGNKITNNTNYMLVYWNPDNKKLLLVDANLPDLPPNQQYQMWALYDGKPIDAGVFNYSKDKKGTITFQKEIPKAQVFAVTVEPAGGSKEPTLSNLCMMGKL